MRIARYIVRVIVLLFMLQVLVIALVINLAAPETVDTGYSRKGIFQTDSKMAVYASPIITRNSAKKQVVILGSSNTTMGLRPDKLQPYLGRVPIHNLSIGSEKFRGMPQLVDLLFRQTPHWNLHNYVFVFGISYPLVADEPHERRNMRTTVDDEERRFGLFAANPPYGSLPRMPNRYISDALQFSWPFLVPKMVYNKIIRLAPAPYQFGLAEEVPFSAEESDTVQYNEAQHQERIAYYNREIIDTTGEFTFVPMLDAIQRITAAGGEVVIVDLPTAQWLQRATPLHDAYVRLRKPYISQLEKMQHVRYINAESGFADEDFYDGIHPRHRITGEIAKKVAPIIKQALGEQQ